MSQPARFCTVRRTLSLSLAVILLVELSPLPVLASRPPASPLSSRDLKSLDQVVRTIEEDLVVLKDQGKEAFLDRLFERMDQDQARALTMVESAVHHSGARKLVTLIIGIGSPVLAAVINLIPEPWQSRIVISTLGKFIRKSVQEIKETVSGVPAERLRVGLQSVARLLKDNRFRDGQAIRSGRTGDSWWEKFFGNSTIVRNFLITVVVVASIGVAVGLAIAGSTAAPIVAVVGALVALIALLNKESSTPGSGLVAAWARP